MIMLTYPEYRSPESGVLPPVPSHWRITRIKFVGSIRYGIGEPPSYVEDGTPLIRATNVSRGAISQTGLVFVDPKDIPPQRIVWLKEGDIVVVRSGAYTGDSASISSDYAGSIAGFDMVLRVHNAEPAFLQYALLSRYLKEGQIDIARTRAAQPHLNAEELGNCAILLPPSREQQAIVNFLNLETAKIDALIGKQEQLIATLREGRTATITKAVTKGLDPNVEMKDSGVEWLGWVPNHWGVRQLKWGSPVRRGASPRPIDDPKYFDDDGEWSWVRIADVSASGGHLYETTQRLSVLGSTLSVRLNPGSLFISIAGTVGKPCVTHIPVCIHDGFVYFPSLDMETEYLYRIFEAGECYRGLGKMGTQLNLNTDTIGSIRLPFPSRAEQKGIVEYLGLECGKIDGLIEKALEVVDTLREYRSALILAAVTGKIDVREDV